MKIPIGNVLAGAITAARSLGTVQALLVVRPPSAAPATDPGDARAREASFVRIEININR
jgi:hypothetical protein